MVNIIQTLNIIIYLFLVRFQMHAYVSDYHQDSFYPSHTYIFHRFHYMCSHTIIINLLQLTLYLIILQDITNNMLVYGINLLVFVVLFRSRTLLPMLFKMLDCIIPCKKSCSTLHCYEECSFLLIRQISFNMFPGRTADLFLRLL